VAAAEYARFVATMADQTAAVEWIVRVAINAIDKPGELNSAPEASLERLLDRYGTEAFEVALSRVRELLALNDHDFVALGAERLLENALAR
jgi:hypothetical protein